MGDKSFSVHAEGERVILKREGEERQEVDLVCPQHESSAEPAFSETVPGPLCPNGSPVAAQNEPPVPSVEVPGSSPLDRVLPDLREAFSGDSHRDGEGGGP